MNTDLMSTNLKHIVFTLFAAMLIWGVAAAKNAAPLTSDNISPAIASDASGYAVITVGRIKALRERSRLPALSAPLRTFIAVQTVAMVRLSLR